MLIRTQNKKAIVNLDNIDSICINSECKILAYNGDSDTGISLAEYNTLECCISVLDDIIDKYLCGKKVFDMPPEDIENEIHITPSWRGCENGDGKPEIFRRM